MADNLPTWDDVNAKAGRGEPLSPLEQFIWDYSPVAEDGEEEFRNDLAAVVELLTGADLLPAINDCDKCDLCEDHHG